jgi:hypothetical protein
VVTLDVPGKSAWYTLQPGVHAKRFGRSDGRCRDGDTTGLPDLWDLLGRGTFASPLVALGASKRATPTVFVSAFPPRAAS